MQLTIDSDEPLDRVLQVVGSLYGVELSLVAAPGPTTAAPSAAAATAAAKAVPARSRRRGGNRSAQVDAAAVRHWARENGHVVRERGRVPAAVVEAYRESLREPG